jgi:hypothetical protein
LTFDRLSACNQADDRHSAAVVVTVWSMWSARSRTGWSAPGCRLSFRVGVGHAPERKLFRAARQRTGLRVRTERQCRRPEVRSTSRPLFPPPPGFLRAVKHLGHALLSGEEEDSRHERRRDDRLRNVSVPHQPGPCYLHWSRF